MDLPQHVTTIEPLDEQAREAAKTRMNQLTKPPGSLGRLETIAMDLAAMTANPQPAVTPPGIIVFAADHGVTAEGVSAFPQEITAQMAKNFLHKGAAINVLASQIDASFRLVDIGMTQEINHVNITNKRIKAGTANFCETDAMTKKEAVSAVQAGFDVAQMMIENQGIRCLILGEMGIGNTTASSAMIACYSKKDPEHVTGPGTGLSPEKIKHKQHILRKALQERTINSNDSIDVLAKVGGLEIAGITGAMLAAAAHRVPVIVDGFISSTAAVTASNISRRARDYMFIGHQSTEPGHRLAIELLNKQPLLDLHMRLGEGSGAALSFPIIQAAAALICDMAVFDDLKSY
ncbi:nicotinate-nucleotide-dimethylbenzimidazole phosphoribosyltransferase [Alteribacillus persepolensis]|uniref:Nicotinate-nucleotide--dimethylbenzimidazole phosphoribosyltransferase n=1 Tax=Alteribacillus persepolensis TaxID=568899 RepID=A0A1G8AAL4_9BACI|nr:nicotinate-nucleotide--dimethylbenzimidazole phosphoribosyltransferase [Alteribacillus persepolensis]SDH17893.1 nicotinate-nucleotide-dimethylbenzimidazole phosphoribosyltransferase [Alteribacillus persepolensis]